MDKDINVRAIALKKDFYKKEYLDSLSDEELSDCALADADSLIMSFREFQVLINEDSIRSASALRDYHWYFLTDLV
jgi:hypothetical protein